MKIAIIDYPDAMKSAVLGLQEMFLMANRICEEQKITKQFEVEILIPGKIGDQKYSAILLPPSLESEYYLKPSKDLTDWLKEKHNEGSILCSACAGAFIIASTGLLNGRNATTHWGFINLFSKMFPDIKLDTNKILINDSDIITAGGMMSWMDLGLELVAQFTKPIIMRQLGKTLVIDTGQREQRYYQQFLPKFDHGDKTILSVQRKLQSEYQKPTKVSELAKFSHLTERTFLRRFVNATELKPNEYLQKLRIQRACDLLENTNDSFESIANIVGYEDFSSCRKIFVRIMGLTPREFRNRFANK